MYLFFFTSLLQLHLVSAYKLKYTESLTLSFTLLTAKTNRESFAFNKTLHVSCFPVFVSVEL